VQRSVYEIFNTSRVCIVFSPIKLSTRKVLYYSFCSTFSNETFCCVKFRKQTLNSSTDFLCNWVI